MLDEKELQDAVFFVIATHLDLPNAMATQEISEKMGLYKHRDRELLCAGTWAVGGDGVYESLELFSRVLGGKKLRSAIDDSQPAPTTMEEGRLQAKKRNKRKIEDEF